MHNLAFVFLSEKYYMDKSFTFYRTSIHSTHTPHSPRCILAVQYSNLGGKIKHPNLEKYAICVALYIQYNIVNM